MKKELVLAMLVFTFLFGNVNAQDDKKKDDREPTNLLDSITGKWQLTDINANKKVGIWDFEADGKFKSNGYYLPTKEALFTTDENRSVVYIQVGEEITEWKASMTNEGGMVLKEITPKKKTNHAEFRLAKIEKN